MATKKAKKSQTPNAVGALTRLKAMAEQPKQTPLEQFVLENFAAIVALHGQGYTVPDICTALKQDGYAASPPTLHAALNKAAVAFGTTNPFKRLDRSIDEGEVDKSETAEAQPLREAGNGSQSKHGKFVEMPEAL